MHNTEGSDGYRAVFDVHLDIPVSLMQYGETGFLPHRNYGKPSPSSMGGKDAERLRMLSIYQQRGSTGAYRGDSD
jgi:hypothetical protein